MESQPVENVVVPQQLVLLQNKIALQNKMKNGINWFFWIAGLSIINSVIFIAGSSLNFVMGLGVTQFVDAFINLMMEDSGLTGISILHLAGFGIDIMIAGIFVVFGVLGRKKHRWAVITGMVLYTLDAILLLTAGVYLGFAFHLLALVFIWVGLKNLNQLIRFESNLKVDEAATIDNYMEQLKPQKQPLKKSFVLRGFVIGLSVVLLLTLLLILIIFLAK
jgi:hypothetical protein